MVSRRKIKTRSVSDDKFGGGACELPESDLPTKADVARYFYFVSISEKDYSSQLQLVEDKLRFVWAKCVPRVPVLEKKRLHTKIKRLLDAVKSLNRKCLKPSTKKFLNDNKDKLFDISTCCCTLPIVSCVSSAVRCTKENCQDKHIVCNCLPVRNKIPKEDREYMRDQRAKKGTRGAYQLGPVDRAAVKRSRELDQEKEKREKRKSQGRVHPQHVQFTVATPEFEVS
jgi:hypothetical protein